jgi:hypothetical protein
MCTIKKFGKETTRVDTARAASRLQFLMRFLIDTLAIRNAPNSLKTKGSNPF